MNDGCGDDDDGGYCSISFIFFVSQFIFLSRRKT